MQRNPLGVRARSRLSAGYPLQILPKRSLQLLAYFNIRKLKVEKTVSRAPASVLIELGPCTSEEDY
jgi:hypothetical protein